MDHAKKLCAQIDALFNAKSVAIVGLPRGMKAGKLFLLALLDQGYGGKIYPVHPTAQEIDGLKAYPSVTAIPGPVDLAIILVPNQGALAVVKDCAAKGVKGAVLFTAGYKETGTAEGTAVQAELTRIARTTGMRLLGPNCMGLYCPKTGLSFFPELSKEPGPVGLISHSGSLANLLGRVAPSKGIRFSKVVSLGNECDLTSADFLTYLSNDPDTDLIGMYQEGLSNGPKFLKALKAASMKKPVILWKVGLTREGGQAAASHTGAMAGAGSIWKAVMQQGGAIPVVGFEALADAMMGFSLLPENLGDRMAILSGPGGLAVATSEACGNRGLRLAKLSQKTVSTLAEFVPPTGTSIKNPVDVGLTASLDIDIYGRAARALGADVGVDAVIILGRGLSPELNETFIKAIIKAQQDYQKPFIMVDIPGTEKAFGVRFLNAGIPYFESAERAMRVYAAFRQYQLWRRANA
jgi:acyl-CoA synthetase (NDP forming)